MNICAPSLSLCLSFSLSLSLSLGCSSFYEVATVFKWTKARTTGKEAIERYVIHDLLRGKGDEVKSVINMEDTHGYCALHYLMHPYATSRTRGQFCLPLNMHFIDLLLGHPELKEVISKTDDTYYTCLLQSHLSP